MTKRPHLFVKYTISFIDVCNVAFLLVQSLAREFRLLVNAGGNSVSVT